MLLGVMGAIPGAGIIARGTKRGAAWMDRNLPQGFNRLLDAAMPSDPKNTTNIIAGPTAKTADQQALSQAQELAQSGASRDDIWQQTGWIQGVDGKWRYEIDDSNESLVRDLRETTSGPLGSILKHDELYAAYPHLKGMDTQVDIHSGAAKPRVAGSYTPFQDRSNEGLFDIQEELKTVAGEGLNPKSNLLHESSHAVANLEGFSSGANLSVGRDLAHEAAWKDAFKAQKELDTAVESLPEALRAQWEIYATLGGDRALAMRDRMIRNPDLAPIIAKSDDVSRLGEMAQDIDPEKAYEMYRRTAGEAEARNVQTRMNMTPAERGPKAPWTTQDVPDDQQIVRFR
jgi:hypothetical protein